MKKYCDENGNLAVFCKDKYLNNNVELKRRIRELIKLNSFFANYFLDLNSSGPGFYIVTHNNRNYLGFYSERKEDNRIFNNCNDITLEELLIILGDKNVLNKILKNIEISAKISLTQTRIDGFDNKRYY